MRKHRYFIRLAPGPWKEVTKEFFQSHNWNGPRKGRYALGIIEGIVTRNGKEPDDDSI